MSPRSRYDSRFWLIALSTLLVSGLAFSLGLWQLDRAAQREKFSQERKNTPPIRLNGHWSAAQTLYVDNRQMQAKQGFFVVTPLLTSATEYVLVERGWIPRDFMDRTKLAPIETPNEPVGIDARQMPDPVPPAVFANQLKDEHPIVAFVDLSAIAKAMPDKAYRGMVQQIGAPSEGLKRDWYEPASGAEKNYGYAFQWFAMCTTVLALYLWFQWIKPMRMKQL
jgi:surfeit locus 1 family protein